jgi:ribosome biogenesis GTPase
MSKRRINQRQSARIEKKQSLFRDNCGQERLADGLVISRFSRHALIESPPNTRTLCSIRPEIKTLVAGDRVVWQAEGSKQGVVISVYPRQSVLVRPDKRGQLRPVAANITQMMIVIAPKPEISWPLLDSYLVVAEYLGLNACIVLNKVDLPCELLQQRLLDQYAPLGYSLIFNSQYHPEHLKNIEEALKQQISVFVGQSGVGKSSLITQVLPHESNISTNAISTRTDLGMHTTSRSCLYHIPTGGALIDSPGVREFGLCHLPLLEIAKGYREFKPFISQCKFRNCNHLDTAGCALLDAVNTQQVNAHRYNNYVKLATQFAT